MTLPAISPTANSLILVSIAAHRTAIKQLLLGLRQDVRGAGLEPCGEGCDSVMGWALDIHDGRIRLDALCDRGHSRRVVIGDSTDGIW